MILLFMYKWTVPYHKDKNLLRSNSGLNFREIIRGKLTSATQVGSKDKHI